MMKQISVTEAQILDDVKDCTAEYLLREAAERASWWSSMVGGTYVIPTGQAGQIYSMLIAANLKASAAKRAESK